jgi:hypothetical protein
MAVTVSQEADGARVTLSGAVGLLEIRQLKSALEQAMLNPSGMGLELHGLTEIDASVMQLIHSWMCSRPDRPPLAVRVSGVSPEVAQQVADLGGGGVGCGRVCGEPYCVLQEPRSNREER